MHIYIYIYIYIYKTSQNASNNLYVYVYIYSFRRIMWTNIKDLAINNSNGFAIVSSIFLKPGSS